MHTIPISTPLTHWPDFLVTAKEMLGFSISESIDKFGVKNEITKLMCALREMHYDKITDPKTVLEEAGSLLRHASMSFLSMLSEEVLVSLREETDLAINSCRNKNVHGMKIAVITGNMEQWRNAVINCCVDRMPKDVRMLMNGYMLYFEQQGLSAIWANLSKVPMPDQTFRLK